MKFSKAIWHDFLDSLFPRLCVSCTESLSRGEDVLCISCRVDLPLTNFHLQFDNNPVVQHFWGKVKIDGAFSMLHFNKGGKVQEMIHQLKYEGREDIGDVLGRWYGRELRNSGFHQYFDLVIPIPLHPKRLQYRGYNQCTTFGKTLSEEISAAFDEELLNRKIATHTQTQKNRMHRWENMQEVFYTLNPEKIRGKRILLVDDVITTGATLEAAAHQLLQAKAESVMIATMASAKL